MNESISVAGGPSCVYDSMILIIIIFVPQQSRDPFTFTSTDGSIVGIVLIVSSIVLPPLLLFGCYRGGGDGHCNDVVWATRIVRRLLDSVGQFLLLRLLPSSLTSPSSSSSCYNCCSSVTTGSRRRCRCRRCCFPVLI